MKIIHLSTEFAPLAKAGGMGDVLVGLSRELLRLGHEVEVILPKYDFIPEHLLKDLRIHLANFHCSENGTSYANTMWEAVSENCRILLLDPHHPKNYFKRGKIYGCEDDAARFLYFCKASLEYLKAKNEPIDALHLHDWHTSAAAVFAKDYFKIQTPVILTIHNAEYQGLCASWDLNAAGLNGSHYAKKEWLQDERHPEALNLLKGGVIFADRVNTVSPSYAKEILTPEIGKGLTSTFLKYKNKLSGILNGIDQIIWNPANDPSLIAPFSAQQASSEIRSAKEKIRSHLREKFQLENNERPWIGSITRIVSQKGPELIEEGLIQTLKHGGSFFLLGSSPTPSLQHHFDLLKKKYAQNKNVCLHFEYDETLAHQLYAALDFLLMPSIFEPCGLSQLIAMRYGTVPIVRKTGGLKDTVFDFENSDIPSEKRNGIVFEKATKEDLSKAIERAVLMFKSDREKFESMILQVMEQDFGWEKSAQLYINLYRLT
jgi:starch synthase